MTRAKSGGATNTLQLRLVARAPKLETLFVTVAGVGTKEWADASGRIWFTGVQSPGIGSYTYEHNLSKDDPNLWQGFSEHGKKLLQSLLSLIDNQHLQHCPILLVGHSLGGFVVKETLRLAYERTAERDKPFKKALAGVILLGTPHSVSEQEPKWQNVAFLPHLTEYTFKIPPLTRDSVQKLSQSSLLFDQSGVICPILTVSEKRQTKVKTGFSFQRIMLVDSTFARTGSREERWIEVDSNHRNLRNVHENPEVQAFIAEILEDARLRIACDSPLSGFEVEDFDEQGYDMTESASEPTTLLDPFTNSATAGSSDLGFELVPEMNPNLQLSRPVALPFYLIPVARNKDFFGRHDVLENIGASLLAPVTINDEEPDHAKSFALCGSGGIGKTQIVTEFAYRCREAKTFDAIFWIYADGSTKLTEGIAQIATSLQLVAADSPEALDPVITFNLVKEWLSNPARPANIADDHSNIQPRWLLILDNVDDTNVLSGLWPFEGPGCVLITSRDPLAMEPTVLADTGCNVNSFSSEESSEMLEQLTKRTGGDGKAIGERLGGLPLAIVQMASIIIRNHMSFEDFIETWDERQTHPEYFGNKSELVAPDSYDKSPSTVWAIDSLRHGKQLLEVMSFYDPDSIQETILKQYSNIRLESYPTKLGDYLKARKELLQTSLARKNASEQILSVHRMVQDATRSSMQRSQYHVSFIAALQLLCGAWPFEAFGWRHGVARWRKCEELFPHVLRMKALGSSIVNELADLVTKIQYCKLMNDAGWFYHETGHFTESQKLIEHAYEVANAMLSDQSKTSSTPEDKTLKELGDIIAEAHHNLGCIGTETNQPEFTLAHFREFNEMMSKRADKNVPDTLNRLAISWNELGNAYMMNKLWQDGERCFKQCLETAQDVQGFSPADFSFPYVNLGLAYWLTQRLDLAQATLEEGLRHREDKYGINDTQSFITGRFLYALGNVTASQGAWADSFAYHDRALQQFLSTIGKNHHRTGDVRIRVAKHLFRMRQFDQASKQVGEALAIFRARAVFRPELARAMFWKSKIVEASGEVGEARKLRGQSLAMYREITHKALPADSEPPEDVFDEVVAFWSR